MSKKCDAVFVETENGLDERLVELLLKNLNSQTFTTMNVPATFTASDAIGFISFDEYTYLTSTQIHDLEEWLRDRLDNPIPENKYLQKNISGLSVLYIYSNTRDKD